MKYRFKWALKILTDSKNNIMYCLLSSDPRTRLWIDFFCYSDCKFDCYKKGTLGEFCDKSTGLCQCKDGYHGDACDKGKAEKKFNII